MPPKKKQLPPDGRLDMAQLSKELHAPVQRLYPRRKVFVDGIDDTWSADLVDMTEWRGSNNGYGWMLNIVDVFSRYGWSVAIQDKSAAVVLVAFASVIKDSGRKPRKLWVDEGKEFYNKQMDAFIKREKIVRYSTFGEHKSCFVERFNRTLKGRMWRYFTEANTRRWIDKLPELMHAYNTSKHRTIKMTPEQASLKKNERRCADIQYGDIVEKTSAPPGVEPKFKLGQYVRISREKGLFEKGYLPNWSREIYKVVSILFVDPYVYELEDLSGETIRGSFYEQNMHATSETPSGEFLVEKVLEEKIVNRKKFYLVKFLGYSSKRNQWIPAENITRTFEPDPQEAPKKKAPVLRKPTEPYAVQGRAPEPRARVKSKRPMKPAAPSKVSRPIRATRQQNVPAWLVDFQD
jgi:hypothetical protein